MDHRHMLYTSDRGVSSVVGVTVLLSLVVILTLLIAPTVFDITGNAEDVADRPDTDIGIQVFDNGTQQTVVIEHNGGDVLGSGSEQRLLIRSTDSSIDGEIIYNGNERIETGAPIAVLNADVTFGDRISVVWQSSDGEDETELASITI